jgi:hypothetical protein
LFQILQNQLVHATAHPATAAWLSLCGK